MDIAPQTSYGEIMHSPDARTPDHVEALSIIPSSDVCTPDIILFQDVSTPECCRMPIEPFFEDLKVSNVTENDSLQKESGKVIKGRHLFIGLEDIKPYTAEFIEYNGQIRLALTDPILPTGTTPRGFLGYAVNMIDHLGTKTAAGHGLRETLFYRLFGKLQVHETKESMKEAYPCVTTDGAVSLD